MSVVAFDDRCYIPFPFSQDFHNTRFILIVYFQTVFWGKYDVVLVHVRLCTLMPHRRLESTSILMLPEYCIYMAQQIYDGIALQPTPISNRTAKQSYRNQQIYQSYVTGSTLAEIALNYGISFQRVSQIIKQILHN